MEQQLPITVDCERKSVSVGGENGIHQGAVNNTSVGHRAGFRTTTSNNILIGVEVDGGGNEVRIGNDTQEMVTIGAYDLKVMAERLCALEEQVRRLTER